MAQRLRLHSSNAGDAGLTPGQGTRSHAATKSSHATTKDPTRGKEEQTARAPQLRTTATDRFFLKILLQPNREKNLKRIHGHAKLNPFAVHLKPQDIDNRLDSNIKQKAKTETNSLCAQKRSRLTENELVVTSWEGVVEGKIQTAECRTGSRMYYNTQPVFCSNSKGTGLSRWR